MAAEPFFEIIFAQWAHLVGETVEYTGGSAPRPKRVECTHEQKTGDLWGPRKPIFLTERKHE